MRENNGNREPDGTAMKILSFCLLICCTGISGAAEQIFLNPSARIGIFRRDDGLWHGAASRLELEYSASHLTLDAVLTVPPGKTFRSAGKAGSEKSVFGGEIFEFQIAPAEQNGVYYHFAVSPTGFMYTARCRDSGWDPKETVLESRVSGPEWHFRLSVPFRDLNAVTPRSGEVWRINLARSDVSSGPVRIISSHSGGSDFHDLSEYSEVVFGKAAPADASVLLQDIRQKNDLLQLDFISQFQGEISLRMELRSDRKLCCSRNAVMRNGSVSIPFPLPFRKLPLKTGIPAEIILKHTGNGKVLCRTAGFLAIRTKMLQPDRFYYTPSDQVIRFQHDLSGTVTVRLYDSSGKLIRTAGSGSSIPLSGLRPGRFVLEAADARTSVSRVVFLLDRPPTLGPLPPGPLTVANGRLCRGSKPVFLFGFSPTAKTFPQFSDAFNLKSYHHAAAAVRKNAVVLNALPDGKEIRKPDLARVFPPERVFLKKLSAQVQKIRPESVPSLWRISYEAQIPLAVKNAEGAWVPMNSKEFMKKYYQTVKKANPALVYSIQTDKPCRIGDFTLSCDVLEAAFWSSSYAEAMIPNLQRDMLRLKREAAPGKALLFWLGGTIPDKTCRLAEEIRMAIYLSILNGFSGNIIHMGHGFLPQERSRLWSLLSGIHAEIESFYDEWASGKELPVKIPAPFVGKAVRTSSGETLLMVINPSPNELLLPGSLPGVPPNDRFTGFEPKLYRLSDS